MSLPEHVCALLSDHRGQLLFQLRPPWIRHAANQLTCFGGKREPGESIVDCLRRELREETGWSPVQAPDGGVDLYGGGRFIARFLPLHLPNHIALHAEPGFIVLSAARQTLPSLPLSPWHRAVIQAWDAGKTTVEVEVGQEAGPGNVPFTRTS